MAEKREPNNSLVTERATDHNASGSGVTVDNAEDEVLLNDSVLDTVLRLIKERILKLAMILKGALLPSGKEKQPFSIDLKLSLDYKILTNRSNALKI